MIVIKRGECLTTCSLTTNVIYLSPDSANDESFYFTEANGKLTRRQIFRYLLSSVDERITKILQVSAASIVPSYRFVYSNFDVGACVVSRSRIIHLRR